MKIRGFLLVILISVPALAWGAPPGAGKPAAPAYNRPYPVRGMVMANVRRIFGAPVRVLPPDPLTAGGPLRPPINRWVYRHFTVYFERNRVIHTIPTHSFKPPRVYAPVAGSSDQGGLKDR